MTTNNLLQQSNWATSPILLHVNHGHMSNYMSAQDPDDYINEDEEEDSEYINDDVTTN